MKSFVGFSGPISSVVAAFHHRPIAHFVLFPSTPQVPSARFVFGTVRYSSHKIQLCCTKIHASEGVQVDLTPLFEKPAAYVTCLRDLFNWRRWAQDLAVSVGSSYYDADGGPDANDLLRELEWMLDDAVSDCVSQKDRVSVLSNAQDASKWRAIKVMAGLPSGLTSELPSGLTSELQYAESSNDNIVRLRASLDDLSLLWRQRVKDRRPFQYVVGCAHWRQFVLCVREGVLIPRPETEQMIDLAEEAIKAHPTLAKGLWADLGTGSGALAVGLACLLHSQGFVIAVDISTEAVSISRHNIQRYGLQNKVEVLHGSWFSVLEEKKGNLAGVLSNPPYIPSGQITSLQAEVGKYEPRNALDGGHQGTNDLIAICEGAAWALCRNGYLILETNGGEQAEMIAKVIQGLADAPFHDVRVVKDISGIVRFVTGVHV